ncbi:(d)CMP kinase [Humidisolicoccus flavus]|uniref:(d)CMP kinase n=1 Tax=Humidisolicoccus flavus TaxID=3111414 RepID=UPI00324EC328
MTIVAIDGPAGSGKSSVSRAAAEKLGFQFLDTGAAYRALAWSVLEAGESTDDARAVMLALHAFDFEIALDPQERWVRVGEHDVTEAIRSERVTAAVSGVAKLADVRVALNNKFRELLAAAKPGIVAEGRDITTIVAPDADVRILLTAAPEVRAARRAGELLNADADAVAKLLAARDAKDASVVDFFTAAEGVTVVDSTFLNFVETVDAVTTHVAGLEATK